MEGTSGFSALHVKKRDYFRKFRYIFELMGMSLESSQNVGYKVYSFTLIFTTIFLYPFLRVSELVLPKDISIDYENFLYPYITTMIFLKSMVFLRNRTKLGKLLDKLEQEPFLPNANRGNEMEEEKLQKTCIKIIKIQSIIYVGGTMATVILIATEQLIRRILSSDYHDWVFRYGQITLVNVTHSPNYELWWFYENFSMVILGIHFAIMDAVVAAVVTYLTFQFKMLQNNIRRIVEVSYNEMFMKTGNIQNSSKTSSVGASMVPWKYLKKFLTPAIDYHLAILSVADEAEEVLNRLFLFLYLNALGMLGVLVAYDNLITRVGTFIICGELIVSGFWAQQLMHEGREVGGAAFDSNFVGADLRFQKSLAMIIRRSQNPVALTAGKFTVVGLSSFIWIIRAGYSTSTVLRQMK